MILSSIGDTCFNLYKSVFEVLNNVKYNFRVYELWVLEVPSEVGISESLKLNHCDEVTKMFIIILHTLIITTKRIIAPVV